MSESPRLDNLPTELICYIASFLEPTDIVRLQHVSVRLLQIARDNEVWRLLCFENSSAEAMRRRRRRMNVSGTQQSSEGVGMGSVASSAMRVLEQISRRHDRGDNTLDNKTHGQTQQSLATFRSRALANWDLSSPEEKVDWYEEYKYRHGPITVSWLERPTPSAVLRSQTLETRGIALLNTPHEDSSTSGAIAVSPMEDGSVCLWNLQHTGGNLDLHATGGRIIGRSKPELLCNTTANARYDRHSSPFQPQSSTSDIVDCISVDSARKRSYIALRRDLTEIDLETLQAVSVKKFPSPITALSTAASPVPLTVGTTESLHLYDPRSNHSPRPTSTDAQVRCDRSSERYNPSSTALGYAGHVPMFESTPAAILHAPSSPGGWGGSADIYVAGRFSSILHFDRRVWPKPQGAIHSGARLSALASLPFSLHALQSGPTHSSYDGLDPSAGQSGSLPGHTILACGEYRGKGSLELYSRPRLAQGAMPSQMSTSPSQDTSFKNRHSISGSKLLSVASHGNRLVVSDGHGLVKWMERDGSMPVRQWSLNHECAEQRGGLFATAASNGGEVVQKLLPIIQNKDKKHGGQENLVIWTGERIGLLSISNRPAFDTGDLAERAQSAEERLIEGHEQEYGHRMRRALEGLADEARFMQGLGLGA
ncbi:MAG: hypothetical protein M1833_003605 [Piccolia ochrophora]|nr:MAG: hypothetical protein M1833_003605 [Piccolia ochrophora]